MQEDRDVRLAERVEQRLESQAGKGASKLVLAAFGIVTTALLSLIAWDMHAYVNNQSRILAAVQTEHDANATQNTTIAVIQNSQTVTEARVTALERKTDAQVAALNALTVQVTHNTDVNRRDRK